MRIARPLSIIALAVTAATLTAAAPTPHTPRVPPVSEDGSTVVHWGMDDSGKEWHSDVLDASVPENNDPANFAPAGVQLP